MATYGISVGVLLLLIANILIRKGKSPEEWLKALPLFHLTMLVYVVSIILDFFI